MNQEELTNKIAKTHRLPKNISERILKTILKTITGETQKGKKIKIRNFGTFKAYKSHGKIRVKFDDSDNIFKYYGKEKK